MRARLLLIKIQNKSEDYPYLILPCSSHHVPSRAVNNCTHFGSESPWMCRSPVELYDSLKYLQNPVPQYDLKYHDTSLLQLTGVMITVLSIRLENLMY